MRILVSGSRIKKPGLDSTREDWDRYKRQREEYSLLVACELADISTTEDEEDPMVVVQGACRDSADEFADAWAVENEIVSESHPADWNKNGKAAGPIRNGEMVALGADVALVFWDGSSTGSFDALKRCVKAGIRAVVVPLRLPE